MKLPKFSRSIPKRNIRNLLLLHNRALEMVLITIFCGVMITTVGILLFTEPDIDDFSTREPTLESAKIDELELWVEENQHAYEDQLDLPPRELFTSDD